ncbi:MAG: peptidase S8/S53 subtilisin kexin sedolisin, partial [uncultured bacterium]
MNKKYYIVIFIVFTLALIFFIRDSKSIFSENNIDSHLKGSNSSKITPQIAVKNSSENLKSDNIQNKTNELRSGSVPKEEIITSEKTKEIQNLVPPQNLKDSDNAILLKVGAFDTSKGAVSLPSELKYNESDFKGKEIYYIVQFAGPVLIDWKNEVEYYGAFLKDYIPNNSFLVRMTPETKTQIGTLSYVKWIGLYHPAFKMSNELLENDYAILRKAKFGDNQKKINLRTDSDNDKEKTNSVHGNEISFEPEINISSPEENPAVEIQSSEEKSFEDISSVLLTIQTFEGGKLSSLFALIEDIPGVKVINSSDERKSRITLEIPIENLDVFKIKAAQNPDVEWIEPYVPPVINNNSAAWIVQTNVTNSTTLWDKGIKGTGQIVAIGDTGLDADMVFFYDAAQGLPNGTVNSNQRKIIAYHDLAGNGDWDNHGHGTHVAGTVAGKSTGTNAAYNGIAYEAKLVIQDVGNSGTLVGIPADLNPYFLQAYNDGARIHTNSWGSESSSVYTTTSQDCDEFAWNHKDFLILFSAGNEGYNTYTIGSPATAKNIITSGASENSHTGYNQNNIAYFSSNGPTQDGRIKPTIVSPGHTVISASSDKNVTTYNSGVRAMAGTSMSCPTHAGSAALVRQYFTDGFYPSGTKTPANVFTPASALIKAVMINSAVNLTGTYTDGVIPSTGQGWGRILLDNTLFFSGDSHSLLIYDYTLGLQTNGTQNYSLVSNGSAPIKITLVWTDYYPSMSAAYQIVNDLDLSVTGPNNSNYKGNVFTNGASVQGGNNDRINVEENIFISNPMAGQYTVTVKGYNIPHGPQPFALVITGLQSGSSQG